VYIIVVGGGKVGYYLAKELVEEGHEVLVIEKDAVKAEREQRVVGTLGDPHRPWTQVGSLSES